MGLTLYHVDWCPECIAVKRKLDELKIAYTDVIVPDIRMFRKQVHAVSGQYFVPVIQDGDLVLTETADILAYLDERYGAGSASSTRFQSQARMTPDTPSDDDAHPSCRIN